MDICDVNQIEPESYDVVFCNIGEHLPEIDKFLEFCRRSLSVRGMLVLTVPAIANPGILEGNLRNPFHVTHLPPKGWLTKLGRFFYAVQGFRHWLGQAWLDEHNFPIDMSLPPEQTRIRETDFRFIASSSEELNREAYNISLVMLACLPRQRVLEPVCDESAFPEECDVEGMKERVRTPR